MNNPILFVNPHLHHSTHTVFALSQVQLVKFLCPPLALFRLSQQPLKTLNHFRRYNPKQILIVSLSCCSFLFYKAGIYCESTYLLHFHRLAMSFIATETSPILYYYQDYLNPLLGFLHKRCTLICEIIISSQVNYPNWSNTLQAIAHASRIVCPSHSILHSLSVVASVPLVYASYGGDSFSDPRTLSNINPSIDYTTSDFHIVARSHSYRKGLDILLESLILLKSTLHSSNSSLCVRVSIAGNISDPQDLRLFNNFLQSISSSENFSVSYRQFAREEYFSLLSCSDLFVMPSRHEGCSTAALEALYHCVPSILSQHCGVDALQHGQHGFILSENSPSHLAKLIQVLITNRLLLNNMRSQLQVDNSLFTWDTYKHALSGMLRDLDT